MRNLPVSSISFFVFVCLFFVWKRGRKIFFRVEMCMSLGICVFVGSGEGTRRLIFFLPGFFQVSVYFPSWLGGPKLFFQLWGEKKKKIPAFKKKKLARPPTLFLLLGAFAKPEKSKKKKKIFFTLEKKNSVKKKKTFFRSGGISTLTFFLTWNWTHQIPTTKTKKRKWKTFWTRLWGQIFPLFFFFALFIISAFALCFRKEPLSPLPPLLCNTNKSTIYLSLVGTCYILMLV